jgi:hypothetical protein
MAGSAGVARVVRRLDAAAEDRRRARARAPRIPGDPARPRLRLADGGGPDLLLQRDRAHGGLDRALLEPGRRGLPAVRGALPARGPVRAADDAARAAGPGLETPRRPGGAAARGRADGRLLQARGPRAGARVHDVGRRPARRLLRARRAQGLDRVERRRRRLGRAANARAPPTTSSTTRSASAPASTEPGAR